MHMPGHKQKGDGDPLWQGIFALDLTEVGDFDDLHAPEGILKRSMELARSVWGAEESFYLVGSATAGILSGISAALKTAGKTVLLARNCHKSVYHACEWMQAKTKFLLPPWDKEAGMFSSLSPEQVEAALEADASIALVVITSPTYEGVISDVGAIARICHGHGVPLMVDEAHGAHLGLWEVFGGSAVAAGADLVVQSLHKTLPSLTQTGILHARYTYVERGELKRRLQMTQSSSPSYLLMASMDRCVRWLARGQKERFAAWRADCLAFREQMEGLKHLHVACPAKGAFALDPTKIPLQGRGGEASGRELADRLSRRGILCEMSLGPNALLYTGAFTEKRDLLRVWEALKEMDESLSQKEGKQSFLSHPPLPGVVWGVSEALAKPQERRELSRLEGEVSAEYLWAYPPGIPLLCPGECIDRETLSYLLELQEQDCRLLTGGEALREGLKIVKNEKNRG